MNNYYSFDILNTEGLINFVTDRSLDINFKKQSREEIRRILQNISDYQFRNIIIPRQTHTNNVVVIDEDNLDNELYDVDGVITKLKGVALTIATADCQSIILYDKEKEVIGNIHSGWKGTLGRILSKGINLMIDRFSSNVEDIIVCIGPSILDCCFEVDKDVVDMFNEEFTDIEEFIILGEIKEGKQKFLIDTVGINKQELLRMGLLEENIYLSNICTKCNSDIYHSYRGQGIDSGRNITLVCRKW